MRVLLVGHPSAERVRAQRLLTDAGMAAEVCRDDDWVCSGMEGHCPLDASEVDVAVAVAPRGQRFDAQGVACIQRARIPLVTIGATASDPVLRFATSTVARIDERVVDVVRAAATDATTHRQAVQEALATHLADGETVVARASRRTGSIRIALHGDITADRVSAVVDIARTAVRAFDPHVKVIDVSFATLPTDSAADDSA